MEHQQISKVVLKNSVVFLSGGVSVSGVIVASKILRIFCCTHKKLGGRKSGSNFAGSKTPTRLTVVDMLNIVSSKEAHLWPQKFQSTNLLSFIFVLEIQISLAKIHMQPSKNEGLLPMIFHFKGWFFKLFLLALHFSRMGEGLRTFHRKNGDRNFFSQHNLAVFGRTPGESEKFDLGPRMQRFGGDVAMPNGGLAMWNDYFHWQKKVNLVLRNKEVMLEILFDDFWLHVLMLHPNIYP